MSAENCEKEVNKRKVATRKKNEETTR